MPERHPPQQRVGSGEDTMITLLLLVGAAIGGGWFLWRRYHPQIATWVIAAQHWQMIVIAHFAGRYESLDQQALMLNPANVTAHMLYRLCHLVGLFYRIPAAIVVGGLSVLCLVLNAPSRFTQVLTLDGLMKVQAKIFRTTAAFVGRDLRSVAMAKGEPRPLDPALHGKEWVDRYARKADGSYDENAARGELTRQLGPVWRGAANAPPVVRCLLAAFALHAAREREAALALLGDFSEAMAPRQKEGPAGPNTALLAPRHIVATADAILRRPELRPYLGLADQHAFSVPALMTVLHEARRRSGVLAPAQFNFVKLIDRRLWFALHSLGFPADDGSEEAVMPTPRIEAAGARDHWAAECMDGRPLLVPSLERALLVVRVAAGENFHPMR
jgi:intracellular multiplication protein IcmP